MNGNIISSEVPRSRADELDKLLQLTVPILTAHLRNADNELTRHQCHASSPPKPTELYRSSIINPVSLSADDLLNKLTTDGTLSLPDHGHDLQGFQDIIQNILTYSVNTTSPGFLDKLYASPHPPGIIADLILSVLNTNVHVYQVSPVLTLIEKCVTKALAAKFGLTGPRSGGVNVQGGSAANMTSMIIARNTSFPETKLNGNGAVSGNGLVMFTSVHGHYSIEKAAQAIGFGSSGVISVPVDADGRMISSEFERLILKAKQDGKVPFYVNATAGTTVLGSFDPFREIAEIAKRHRMWFHVDAAWGGGFAFSGRQDLKRRLDGVELADSIATNPHKMLGVPLTCSFLLGKDMRQFQEANTLKAGYLFHDDDDDECEEQDDNVDIAVDARSNLQTNGESHSINTKTSSRSIAEDEDDQWTYPNDLADLTLQCGRRGDALKLFVTWQYYGSSGLASKVDNAYDVACCLSRIVSKHPDLTPVLPPSSSKVDACEKLPNCLQVCFYFTPSGKFVYYLENDIHNKGFNRMNSAPTSSENESPRYAQLGSTRAGESEPNTRNEAAIGKLNSSVTRRIAKGLISRGFMVDFAPALEGQEERGSFFRVVVNISTIKETVERLVRELIEVGWTVVKAESKVTRNTIRR